MPITRFEIRNECGLADPALYQDADKDDPEALLEGVAMAGLVGVIRQLGDLAEFAAEIFHDLHEEVLATAARGHGLMIRVQQLEAEVPSVERAFLSQTDHSSLFNHVGVDWHPNQRIKRNSVSGGALPRFIMDSCEGCRGPPRLFLLDKFDTAGAGACLKRYTDPSIFKVENSEVTAQMEKRRRKVKNKGTYGTNGGVHEVLPTSNTKLHQLFLEESSKNIVGKHSQRAKLKRGLNAFPFEKKTEKSYMDILLNSPSADREVTMDSSSPGLATNDQNNSVFEVLEVKSMSPDNESVGRIRSFHTSLDREEIMLNSSVYEPSEVLKSYPGIESHGMPSNPNELTCEKVIGIDGENHGDCTFDGYLSDDIASEVDNFLDAPSTMDSEIDSDSDFRIKSEFTSSHTETLPGISHPIEEHLQSRSLDSQSTGDFAISEGNNSSRKELFSRYVVDSPSISTENIRGSKTDNRTCCQKLTTEQFPFDRPSNPIVFDNTGIGTDAITSPMSDVQHLTSGLHTNKLPRAHSKLVMDWSEGMLMALKSNQTSHNMDDEDKRTNLVVDVPCSPRVSNLQLLSGDDSPKPSIGDYGVDESTNESLLSKSADPDNRCHKAEGSVSNSFDLMREVESEWKDKNLVEEIVASSNTSEVLAMTADSVSELVTSINTIELSAEFTAHNEDDVKAMVFKGKNAFVKFDEESHVFTDNPVQYIVDTSSLREKRDESSVDAPAKDSEHQLSLNHTFEDIAAGTSDTMEMRGTIMDTTSTRETIIEVSGCTDPKSLNEVHLLSSESDSGACESQPADTDFAQQVISNGAAFDNTHLSSNHDALSEIGNHFSQDSNPGELKSDKNLLYPSHKKSSAKDHVVRGIADSDSDELGNDENLLSQSYEKSNLVDKTTSTRETIIEVSGCTDPKSLNEVHLLSSESDSGACESQPADTDFAQQVISNGAAFDNTHLSSNHDALAEIGNHFSQDSNPGELKSDKNLLYPSHKKSSAKDHVVRGIADSDSDELGNDENLLSQSYEKSNLVDKACQENSVTLMSRTMCIPLHDDYHKPEVPDTVPNLCLDVDVDHSIDSVTVDRIQSPAEPSFLGREQGFLQRSGHGNHVSVVPFFPYHDAEESVVEEKDVTEFGQIGKELLHSGEIDTELSCHFPIGHLETPDLYDHIGGNNSASTFALAECTSPSSNSKFPLPISYHIDIQGCPEDPSGPISPQINPFSGKDRRTLADLPHLPPLPPVQWRMGKIQLALSYAKEETMKNDELSRQLIPPLTASTDDVCSSLLSPSDNLLESSTLTSTGNDASAQLLATTEYTCVPLPASTDHVGSSQSYSCTDDAGYLHEEIKHSDTEIISETVSKAKKVENSCNKLDAKVMQETSDLLTRTENKYQQFDERTSGNECIAVAVKNEGTNANHPVKKPLPRNPLVEDIAVLDRSKLKKVVERARPQIQKVDERDAFLEQIRTKSFNLKPATSSRPSIRGPNTNLKVAAILEKANAIRQALTGSDEDDDDDSWSD